MKKSLLLFQFRNTLELYSKLKKRLDKNIASGTFYKFTKRKRAQLIARLERLRAQLSGLQQGLKWTSTTVALCAMLNATEANAQATAIGTEFQVNTFTTNAQKFSEIAVNATGDFVIAWSSYLQDNDSWAVVAQRYNAAGTKVGDEFIVNTFTTSEQSYPTVAIDNAGNFVIAWSSYAQDGWGAGIYAQRFNNQGTPQGSEFRVNTYTDRDQFNQDIAMDADGDFVITWDSYLQDGGGTGIYAQRYNAQGVAQGSEFRVNTTTVASQHDPAIGMADDGTFVIAWVDYLQSTNGSIFAQRYNSAGIAQGSQFKVNDAASMHQNYVDVAMDNAGKFVITWESQGQDGSGYGIYSRRYDAIGVAKSYDVLVNTYTTNDQTYPSIAMDDDGDYVISWRTKNQGAPGYDCYAQCFDASGTAKGTEFRINTTSHDSGDEYTPKVAMDSGGDFVVTWQAYHDGDNSGIFAQRYAGGFAPTAVQNGSTLLFNFYPNPAQDQLQIDLKGSYKVRILNLYGQVVKEETLSGTSMSIEGLNAGTYLMEVSQDDKRATQKLVIE